ncbi:MAG TPA: hypothetical protein VF427_11350 [Noviherbaspirillum sp.]
MEGEISVMTIRGKASARNMACIVACLSACLGSAHARQPADEIVLSRYTTQIQAPDAGAMNPLAVVAHIRFPRGEVNTVGDAIAYLLLRTGYVLADPAQLDASVKNLFDRPLPESHRQLGTYRVELMLQLLMGDAFELRVDHLRRIVSYSPKAAPQFESAEKGQQP